MRQHLDLVTLGLGREIFAVPVGCVLEIVAMRELVHIPDSPEYLAGLTEVRNRAVPVIDLRRKLGMPPAEVTHQTRIIVLEVAMADRSLLIGLIADRVIEVISLDRAQIGPPPEVGSAGAAGYISGIGRDARGFVIIFDMVRLLSGDVIAPAALHLTQPSATDWAA